jgi:hypothetical protein
MKESCVQFGDEQRLCGVLTEPDAGSTSRGALVLVTAGLVPSFGPFRLYAELARRLAREGFSTLRFDVEGIGDSVVTHPSLPFVERTLLGVGAAAELLRDRRGTGDLVLAGLCSGAEDAFRAAARLPSVGRVVLVDPFSYRTSGWLARNVAHRALRRARRALGLFRPPPRRGAALSGDPGSVVHYQYMRPEESTPILRQLVERGTGVHFVYTGGSEAYNHPGQLAKMFPDVDFRGRVTVDYLPWLDHTQVLAEDRKDLVETITHRLTDGPPQPSGYEAGRVRSVQCDTLST